MNLTKWLTEAEELTLFCLVLALGNIPQGFFASVADQVSPALPNPAKPRYNAASLSLNQSGVAGDTPHMASVIAGVRSHSLGALLYLCHFLTCLLIVKVLE